MKIKINDKEFSFHGYSQPLQSIQQLAEECYQQGRADAIDFIIDNFALDCDDCEFVGDCVNCDCKTILFLNS